MAHGFTEDGARRIVNVVRKVERGSPRRTMQRQRSQSGYPVPTLLAKAAETISPSCDGDAVVWESTDVGNTPSGTGSTVTVRDWLGLGASSGDAMYLFRHLQSGDLYFIPAPRKPNCIFALSTDLTTATSAVAATIIEQLGAGVSHAATAITLRNVPTAGSSYLFEGSGSAQGTAFWTGSSDTWMIDNMECP